MIKFNNCIGDDGKSKVRAMVIITPDQSGGDIIRVMQSGGSTILEGSRNAFEDLCAQIKINFGFDF